MEHHIAEPSPSVAPAKDGPQASWRDLREWLALVERNHELQRVKKPVSADEELSAIAYMAARSETAPALLFENISGDTSGARVLANMLGSSKERYALAVGLDPDLSIAEMIAETRGIMSRRIPPKRIPKSQAPVNEVVLRGDDIDLTKFPAPKFWPGDGGRYIGTGDITLTASPDTGRINVGCYRQMLHGPRRVGLYCSPGKHGLLDREAWWRQGKPCEVVVAYGIDPVLFMLAAQVFGAKESEFDVAGGMMGRGIELTDGETGSLPIPAHAEFVIEGTVTEGDVAPEGPLGEFTGYYGRERSPQPVIDVKALHMRKSPIGAYYAIMRSARILDDLERIGVPGVAGAYAHPAAASGWGIVVVSLQQQYAGHAAQVLALAAQCPAAAYYTKWIIAVDDDVDPTDFNEVMWALSTRCHPAEDIDILKKTWSTGLDPSQFEMERRPYGSKALIDACKPHRHMKAFPQTTLLRREVYERIAARWAELGFSGPPPRLNTFHKD
jgi:UbiD family decarboxylase